MNNPYSPPTTLETERPAPTARSRKSNWAVAGTFAFLALAVVAFSASGYLLLTQAVQLQAESDQMQVPAGLKNPADRAAHSSTVLGIASVVLAWITTVGAVLALRRRLLAAGLILALCIAVFIILAVIFKPI